MKTIRIIKKEKDGVTLKGGKGIPAQKFSWEDFNSCYTISPDDLHLAIMKPEFEKEIAEKEAKAEEILNNIMVSLLAQRSNDVSFKMMHLASLSTEVDELADVIGCSVDDALSLAAQRWQALMRVEATGFSHKETPAEYKARKEREKQTRPEMSAKVTLGDLDALKDLKASFSK